MRAILILGAIIMAWPDDMRAMSAAIEKTRRKDPDSPWIVPRDLPSPRLKDEPTLKEELDQSLFFQQLEERLKKRPLPARSPAPYGNQFLPRDSDKYPRIDENAPIKNPWGN